jgi:hypothetical protein
MMQITIVFDTDQPTAARIYDVLIEAQQAQQVQQVRQIPSEDPPAAKINRQRAAANARAAKAAKAPSEDPAPVEDLLAPPAGGNGADPGDEDLGLDTPGTSLSPSEARDAALSLIREVYHAGKVGEVKALQRAWAVAKFYDVPVERGHDFYAAVLEIAQAAGLRP